MRLDVPMKSESMERNGSLERTASIYGEYRDEC